MSGRGRGGRLAGWAAGSCRGSCCWQGCRAGKATRLVLHPCLPARPPDTLLNWSPPAGWRLTSCRRESTTLRVRQGRGRGRATCKAACRAGSFRCGLHTPVWSAHCTGVRRWRHVPLELRQCLPLLATALLPTFAHLLCSRPAQAGGHDWGCHGEDGGEAVSAIRCCCCSS